MTDRDALTEADRMAALLHKSWIGCAWNDEWGDEAARTCDYKDHRPNAERLIAAGVALVQPAEPGLDVERLGRAERSAHEADWQRWSLITDEARGRAIAAEYARLATLEAER